MYTWQEIKIKYPNEHVVIVKPQVLPKNPTQLESGEVIDHDPVLDTLLSRCDLSAYDSYALKYTGDLGEVIGSR